VYHHLLQQEKYLMYLMNLKYQYHLKYLKNH
jgi:hypothetical protein